MSRQQKKIWNPVLVALKPSHLSWLIWIVLFPFMYNDLDRGEPGFLLGLAVGLTFLQAGYAWGQYHSHWWRFFNENRSTIFKSTADNHPTKKKAFIYTLAVLAKNAYLPLAILLALFATHVFDRYIGLDFNWVLQLLISCCLGAITAHFMVRKFQGWGEGTVKRLTDFSYVFESDPEKDLQS